MKVTKRLSLWTLCVSLTATTSSLSFAQGTQTPLDYQKIGANLTLTMLDCPNRIWPNYNWRAVNVLIGADGQAPVVWRGQSGQLFSLPVNQVPAGAFGGMYSFPTFEGKDAVAFYLFDDDSKNFGDRRDKQVFQTIVHEGFHKFGQAGWSSSEVNQRGTLYPISATPRLYRRMIFDRMKEYFISGGASTDSLSKAAYWNAKWKSQFPDEYKASMDRIEGTARFVEVLAPVVASGGCQMSEADVYAGIVAALNTEMGFSVAGSSFQLDSEGYDVGSLAGFILRFINRDATWYDRVAKGSSPLDVLLSNVTATSDTITADLTSQFEQFAGEQNKLVSSWLDADLSLVNNNTSIRIVPNDGSFQSGSYSPKGFFLSASLPGTSIVPLAQGVEFHDHTWKLNVAADKVMFGMLQSPCSGHYALAIPQNEGSISNGVITVRGSGLEGSMTGVLKTDSTGRKWFCESEK